MRLSPQLFVLKMQIYRKPHIYIETIQEYTKHFYLSMACHHYFEEHSKLSFVFPPHLLKLNPRSVSCTWMETQLTWCDFDVQARCTLLMQTTDDTVECDCAVLREQGASPLQQVLWHTSWVRMKRNDSAVSWSLSEFEFKSVQWQQHVDKKWPPASLLVCCLVAVLRCADGQVTHTEMTLFRAALREYLIFSEFVCVLKELVWVCLYEHYFKPLVWQLMHCCERSVISLTALHVSMCVLRV